MKTMEIFEPAMCCSTGVCGVNVDPELMRVAVVLEHLKKHDIIVGRYNLSSAPQAFILNKVVADELHAAGSKALPLILVDGEIVIRKRYPTNEEFCSLLEVSCEYVSPDENCCKPCCSDSSDCCKPKVKLNKNSGCCGTGKKGGCC